MSKSEPMVVVMCDGCYEEVEAHEYIFILQYGRDWQSEFCELQKELEAKGWLAVQYGSQQSHYCPDCRGEYEREKK